MLDAALRNKDQNIRFRLAQASCFCLPVIAGAAGLMWYNFARFGSPFDFGTAYQLTVSDIHANSLQLSQLPAAIYHFFFQQPIPKNTFPFFEPHSFSFCNYGSYKYTADAVGALSYPMIFMGILLTPAVMRKSRTGGYGKALTLQRRSFFIISILTVLFVAWQDFCLGGIIQRYITDIMPIMVIFSIAAIFCIPQRHTYKAAALSMALSCCIGWMLCVEVNGCALSRNYPNLFDILEDLIIFWQ